MTAFYLWLNTIAYALLGLWCALRLDTTSAKLGYASLTDSGRIEYFTVYGGLQWGLALAFGYLASRGDLHRVGVAVAIAARGARPTPLPAAAEQGVRSILGVPFEVDDDAWAGLNVYSPAPHHFEADVIASIQQEVDRASGALRLAIRLASHREAEHDLHAAMSSHTVISLAAGIIMGQNRCTHAEAMRILKDASNHRNVKLRELADDLVSSLDPDYLENHFRA